MKTLSTYEQLAFGTIRIECDLSTGGISTGTGFFFRFADDGSTHVPAIVTNKHVVRNGTIGRILFTLQTVNGEPDIGNTHSWAIDNFEKAWIPHPNPMIDLCVMPISHLISLAQAKGKFFAFTYLASDLMPTDEDINNFVGMEKIIMVGYPNGIWDQKNNFPVFRSGVTATHYRYDWNGKPEFLIDAACFPGSSGSPVLVCDIGQVHTRAGLQIGSTRIKFLGVLYAGPQHRVDGTVEIVPIPIASHLIATSQIPNNLGMVIKSRMLNDFDVLFRNRP
ncbi:MAG: trypsin-like peptidase domain-containing protein [Holophagaceae bacterium]|nr:trypsin-like peptidase domain-containing protein [Holophagaceae bacterium]